MSGSKDVRTYQRADCAVFRKTAEAFGGLSNMAPGFPVRVNGVHILTVEALYQACRFPHRPEVQRKIIEQSSPMTAKMVGKPFRKDSRPDWDRVRVKIMRWVLRLKLATHWSQFSELLLSTGDQPIVEDSRKDDFWGAVPVGDTSLVGMNVLGRLLMELREEVKQGGELRRVEPPAISDFHLFDEVLGIVDFRNEKSEIFVIGAEKKLPAVTSISLSLFDEEFIEATTKRNSVDPAPKPVFEQRSGLIADLKPYAAYRAAEGDWLGQVPSHWIVRRMKYVVQENDSRSTTGDEQLLRVSQFTGVTQRLRAAGQEEQDTRAASLVGYKRVAPDELVINIMLAWNGSMGVSRYPGIASPAYCVYRFRPVAKPWYFHHLLRSPAYKARIKAMSTGVVDSRLRLYSDDLFRIEALLPPPEEQAAIVRFLDWANARLERTIRAKRGVIALLTEQKQAIIHRAVTRGLDSTVPLKPSGIAWLGDIPAHWEVLALKRVLRRLIDCEHKTAPKIDDSEFRVVRTTAVRNGDLRMFGTYCTTPEAYRTWTRRGLPEVGDVVFTREAPAGEACLVPDGIKVCLGQRTVLMKPNRGRLNAQFLVDTIYAGPPRIAITLATQGSTVGHFNMVDIGALTILLPPKQEQDQIVESVREQTAGLVTAISRLDREIDLLREYRTRLVADVVTGKLDVREAAASLPQDELPSAVEPDALDADDDPEDLDESKRDDEETAA
jgi:type I restriction enzyme S subunit